MGGHHLRQRVKRKIVHRLQDLQAIISFLAAVFNSYRLFAELLPLLPLVACLAILSAFPDWALTRMDSGAEWAMCMLLGGKCAKLRDGRGRPTGQRCLYSIVGALNPAFELPDERLLCVPTNDTERELAFPSPAAAGYGNATFLALCMKLAYEDWLVVRDVVNHEWRHPSLSSDVNAEAGAGAGQKRFLAPRFIQGCSFNFMQAAGAESSEELSDIHLDSDAVLLAAEDPTRPATAEGAAEGASGAGVAVVLAFRGTEPLELADFQSDFDAVPEAGEWGCLHPGFLLALGLDPNLNPYHQTLTTYTTLDKEAPAFTVVAARPATPYEILRDAILAYLEAHPTAKLFVTGHSLGGALAVVFMGALMHDNSKRVNAIKSRVGALYTFGQPRVGDYEFLCHLQVSLLEPSKAAGAASGEAAHSTSHQHAAAAPAGGGHHTEHAMTASGASKLRSLLKGHQEQQDTAPPLTSRYIRVVNTFDIVPHIPPTLCNLYQHGGDLLYLQMTPGSIKFLTEQPPIFITGMFSSGVVKLVHYTKVLLGMQAWKGRDNYIRWGMRLAAVLVPYLMGGLNDHMPGDYFQHITNSDPAAWQPFKPRKRLSRWANAVIFARALQTTGSRPLPTAKAAAGAAAASASGNTSGNSGSSSSSKQAGYTAGLSAKLQARVVPLIDKAANIIAGTTPSDGSSNGGRPAAAAAAGQRVPKAVGGAADAGSSGSRAAGKKSAGEVPESAAARDDTAHARTAAARAKLKGLAHRAVGSANAQH